MWVLPSTQKYLEKVKAIVELREGKRQVRNVVQIRITGNLLHVTYAAVRDEVETFRCLGICSGYPTIERLIQFTENGVKMSYETEASMKDFEEWIKTQSHDQWNSSRKRNEGFDEDQDERAKIDSLWKRLDAYQFLQGSLKISMLKEIPWFTRWPLWWKY